MQSVKVFTVAQHERGYLSDTELRVFLEYFNYFQHLVPTPDRVLFIRCGTNLCQERIGVRSRKHEVSGCDLDYLKRINDLMERSFVGMPNVSVLNGDGSAAEVLSEAEAILGGLPKSAVISVEGCIGAGKSTLIEGLSSRWDHIHAQVEPVEEWPLDLFYGDPARHAFMFQMCCLLSFVKRWVPQAVLPISSDCVARVSAV